MRISKKEKPRILKIKKASFFVFGLSLFFLPGQNGYLNAQTKAHPSLVKPVTINLPRPGTYPVNFTGAPAPVLTAKSVLVIDRDSAVVSYQKNDNARLLPASTVKIMTALVALDHYRPEEILTVGDIKVDGQKIGLISGEKISMQALLNGLLVASGNDAAIVLAQNYTGGQQEFVKAMNLKARELNLKNTYYANPTGLDSDDKDNLLPHHSFTSTLDLARLTMQALRNPLFSQIVATPQITVSDESGKAIYQLDNVNQLLGQVEGLKGVKTGWTKEAGECLVSYTERNGKGIVSVVLGSNDRFGETARIVDWIFNNFRWEGITAAS